MSRRDGVDPWDKPGFQKKPPIAKKNPIETITLSEGIQEVLVFLKAPEAGMASVDSFRNDNLKTQIKGIQTEHPSVYNTKRDSVGDTKQRRDLKVALDDISAAAKTLLDDYKTKSISKGALRRTYIVNLQAGLEKVAACKEAFEKSGSHDGQEASGRIWQKMFDGNTLEAAVLNQAQTMVSILQTLAEKTSDKQPRRG